MINVAEDFMPIRMTNVELEKRDEEQTDESD
jgi:hypothetical protein